MEKLGINLGFLLFQIFNFTILVILLYALAYKPILNMLETRKKKIAQGIEDARVAADARANAEKEAQDIITKAQAEASQKIREATERAEKSALEIQAKAEGEAAKVREEALADVASERDSILADMRGQIAALAMAAAQKLIGESLDEQRQRTLIDEFFSGVKAGKVVILEETGVIKGEAAHVTSALPLTPVEQEAIKQNMAAKIGQDTPITFKVNPSILGGVIIRVGDKVMDGSVAGQLESLHKSLS
ncbi:MAG: F0F1 ATP synthase subunit B [Anaerolineales bacterium]|nr:F0F1 ATP synthase subunit B [Anaerolineales bacterium]